MTLKLFVQIDDIFDTNTVETIRKLGNKFRVDTIDDMLKKMVSHQVK